MPTYDEIASQYAEKIKSAVKGSGLTKSASSITESVKRDKIVNVLKKIFHDIKTYTKDNKPLSDSDKEDIFKLVGMKLGLSLQPFALALVINLLFESSESCFSDLWLHRKFPQSVCKYYYP